MCFELEQSNLTPSQIISSELKLQHLYILIPGLQNLYSITLGLPFEMRRLYVSDSLFVCVNFVDRYYGDFEEAPRIPDSSSEERKTKSAKEDRIPGGR